MDIQKEVFSNTIMRVAYELRDLKKARDSKEDIDLKVEEFPTLKRKYKEMFDEEFNLKSQEMKK
jgi:hypothetical protein